MHKIQVISNGTTPEEQIRFVNNALELGSKWIQFRFKNQDRDTLFQTGKKIFRLCQEYGATFIVNDHVWLAKELKADGVHLGKMDGDIRAARQLLGPHKMIGGSSNTVNDILQYASEKVDYMGLGPLRFTKTKENLNPILGLDGYRNIVSVVREKNIKIPIYAIGGVNVNDVDLLKEIGIDGIAISSLIQTISKNDWQRINQILN